MGRWYVTVQSHHQSNNRRSRGQGRFACGTCDRRYHQEKNLRRHVTNECGKQPKHPCAFCPYKATYKSYLQVHMLKHKRHGFVPRPSATTTATTNITNLNHTNMDTENDPM
ncbi:hypothetical protein M0804_015298 [Polistes exclamans]|nr:hypothetical protein M0804_015300 [Polistes exclamans]KAI4473524.1 hypothetical protein M0804_015298 [Polistes exclamans]